MLWAQFQPKNDGEAMAMVLGHIFAILLCGGIPLVTGLVLRKPMLGLTGGLVSAACAIPFACLSGFPVSLIFFMVILILGLQERSNRGGRRRDWERYDEDEYDGPRRRRRQRRRHDEIEDEEEEREVRRTRGARDDDRSRWKRRLKDIDEHDRRIRRRDFDD